METSHTSQQVKHVINGQEFVSTYKITTRSGFNGESLECVEVDHAYTDGRIIASNGISCHSSPDAAWSAYKNAIATTAWGSM